MTGKSSRSVLEHGCLMVCLCLCVGACVPIRRSVYHNGMYKNYLMYNKPHKIEKFLFNKKIPDTENATVSYRITNVSIRSEKYPMFCYIEEMSQRRMYVFVAHIDTFTYFDSEGSISSAEFPQCIFANRSYFYHDGCVISAPFVGPSSDPAAAESRYLEGYVGDEQAPQDTLIDLSMDYTRREDTQIIRHKTFEIPVDHFKYVYATEPANYMYNTVVSGLYLIKKINNLYIFKKYFHAKKIYAIDEFNLTHSEYVEDEYIYYIHFLKNKCIKNIFLVENGLSGVDVKSLRLKSIDGIPWKLYLALHPRFKLFI